MAKAGKIVALIGAILTLVGTYFFTLVEGPLVGMYVYGAGGMFNIDDMITSAISGGEWQSWILIVAVILYLLSGFIQLLGIKSRIAAFFGSLLPLTVCVLTVLLIAGVGWIFLLVIFVLGADPLVTNVLPVTFEYGFMSFGLGTIIVGLGGLLSLVSVFMSRDDF